MHTSAAHPAHRLSIAILLLTLLVAAACGPGVVPSGAPSGTVAGGSLDPSRPAVSGVTPSLDRGINLAGDFETEPRGSWGRPIQSGDYQRVADAGFDHVRMPIRWSSHTGPAPGHRIDAEFFGEVDEVIRLARQAGLSVIIDVHHFDELTADPAGRRAEFLAIWDQIARRYQNQPATVVFELLNEPVDAFTDRPQIWNELAADALAVVRRTNPTRPVIIGPVGYNHPAFLDDLVLPVDRNLIATVHTYDPSEFTHQGAEWANPVPPTGVTWAAEDVRLSYDWSNWSWDTDTTISRSGFTLEFDRQFAAFAIAAATVAGRADELVIEADRNLDAVVLCNFHDDRQPVEVELTWDRAGRGRGDVSACGEIETLAIQTLAPQTAGTTSAPVTLSRLALCAATCDELIVTEFQALERLLSDAADWATAQGVPLYLGEFGVYDPPGATTDPASRVAWTRSVRSIAESLDIGWGYFALYDGFGLVDRADRWDRELMAALLD